GSMQAFSGRNALAERLYRQALEKAPNLLAARQNLAVLLSGIPDRFPEAIDLWRQNLARSPEYMPSKLSLAGALVRSARNDEAIQEYTEIVALKPEYVAARLALAGLLARQGNAESALAQLRAAVSLQPENAAVHEQIGDIERSRGRSAEAIAAYQLAL